jgi:TIR domain/NB-ARC domain
MLSVFPCYAPRDKPFALDLAAFLERGADVQVFLEDGEIRDGETILSKAADGLQADVILLILSPGWKPARWQRTEWEPALCDEPNRSGVKVGTILAGACEFPAVLRGDAFFDATQNTPAAFRAIKRWLLGFAHPDPEGEFEPARQVCEQRDAELESLRQALADAPGAAVIEGPAPGSGKTTLALEFARQSRREFEALVWLSCAGQSLASLTGEMAAQLGMRLEGEEEHNLREIMAFCAQRRILVVLDDAPEMGGRLIARGRSSTLLTTSRVDYFQGTGRTMAIEPIDERAPRRVLAGLGPEHRNLLAAACACGDAPFRPSLPMELSGFDPDTAAALLRDLLQSGLVIKLDSRYSRCVTHAMAREVMPPSPALARAHAQAVNRLFADWTREDSECKVDLPQLRRALEWALSERDDEAWTLACGLANRGVASLKSRNRQAEAFELLEALSWNAEQREDRRVLDGCLRDQIWILESWDRFEDAQRLHDKRQSICEDQMRFMF